MTYISWSMPLCNPRQFSYVSCMTPTELRRGHASLVPSRKFHGKSVKFPAGHETRGMHAAALLFVRYEATRSLDWVLAACRLCNLLPTLWTRLQMVGSLGGLPRTVTVQMDPPKWGPPGGTKFSKNMDPPGTYFTAKFGPAQKN